MHVIQIFSFAWYLGIVGCILGVCFTIVLLKHLSPPWQERVVNSIAFLLIFDVVFSQAYDFYLGVWTLSYSLPLQYCTLFKIIAAISLISKGQWLFEVMLFLGIIAPFQSFMAPAMAHATIFFFMKYYFFSHSAICATPIILFSVFKMRPRRTAWYKICLSFLPVAPIMLGFNYLVKGNYMFLVRVPNPDYWLSRAPWPYYIFVWIGSFFITSYLIHRVVLLIERKWAHD